MTIDKILVGDDNVGYAKKVFLSIPNATVEFVSTPEALIEKARTGNYSIIVTDLNYTKMGWEGYAVLKALKGVAARKILWTGDAYMKEVQDKGKSLGAEVLGKGEEETRDYLEGKIKMESTWGFW